MSLLTPCATCGTPALATQCASCWITGQDATAPIARPMRGETATDVAVRQMRIDTLWALDPHAAEVGLQALKLLRPLLTPMRHDHRGRGRVMGFIAGSCEPIHPCPQWAKDYYAEVCAGYAEGRELGRLVVLDTAQEMQGQKDARNGGAR